MIPCHNGDGDGASENCIVFKCLSATDRLSERLSELRRRPEDGETDGQGFARTPEDVLIHEREKRHPEPLHPSIRVRSRASQLTRNDYTHYHTQTHTSNCHDTQ